MKKTLDQMTDNEIRELAIQQDFERWTYGRYLTDAERDERAKSNDMNWRPWHKSEQSKQNP